MHKKTEQNFFSLHFLPLKTQNFLIYFFLIFPLINLRCTSSIAHMSIPAEDYEVYAP